MSNRIIDIAIEIKVPTKVLLTELSDRFKGETYTVHSRLTDKETEWIRSKYYEDAQIARKSREVTGSKENIIVKTESAQEKYQRYKTEMEIELKWIAKDIDYLELRVSKYPERIQQAYRKAIHHLKMREQNLKASLAGLANPAMAKLGKGKFVERRFTNTANLSDEEVIMRAIQNGSGELLGY